MCIVVKDPETKKCYAIEAALNGIHVVIPRCCYA